MLLSESAVLGAFLLLIVIVLMIDLLWVGRKSHVVSTKEALLWTSVWVGLAFGFYLFLHFYGHLLHGIDTKGKLAEVLQKYAPRLKFHNTDFAGQLAEYRKYMSVNYLSGYFIEETLSIDNIFVILMILKGFSVSLENYKTVLF